MSPNTQNAQQIVLGSSVLSEAAPVAAPAHTESPMTHLGRFFSSSGHTVSRNKWSTTSVLSSIVMAVLLLLQNWDKIVPGDTKSDASMTQLVQALKEQLEPVKTEISSLKGKASTDDAEPKKHMEALKTEVSRLNAELTSSNSRFDKLELAFKEMAKKMDSRPDFGFLDRPKSKEE